MTTLDETPVAASSTEEMWGTPETWRMPDAGDTPLGQAGTGEQRDAVARLVRKDKGSSAVPVAAFNASL